MTAATVSDFHSIIPSVLWHGWAKGRAFGLLKKTKYWYVGGGGDLTWACHVIEFRMSPGLHFLLQQNPEWFYILVPVYPVCPGVEPGCQSNIVVLAAFKTRADLTFKHNTRGVMMLILRSFSEDVGQKWHKERVKNEGIEGAQGCRE